MPIILRTKPFDVDLMQLSFIEQKQVLKSIRFLAENPRHPSLQIHKVEGTNLLEAYVNMDIRILFERSSDTILLKAVGHHDILRNY